MKMLIIQYHIKVALYLIVSLYQGTSSSTILKRLGKDLNAYSFF